MSENSSKKSFWSGAFLGLLVGALTISMIYFGRNIYSYLQIRQVQSQVSTEEGSTEAASGEETTVVNTKTMQKLQTLEELIKQYYYKDTVTEEELETGIYKGLVEALGDPYSEYYSAEELEETMNSTEGISYGIGAYISLDPTTELAMISGVMEDTPAEAAGLREGDIIYKVDGTSTAGMSITQVVSMVKGMENTAVHLTIYREGETDYLEIDVNREKLIETTTVDAGMIEGEDGIGYLRIREFDTVTLDQFTEAMAELNANGMKGLILDLRSNPGGNLNTAVEIARRFLPEGLIVYTEDKYGERTEYTCDGTHEFTLPLTVLVNGNSASASEILAGAIQDYQKGTLIGTTTYGKGIVQNIKRLNDGTAIKLTISSYYTPLGRNIHGIGIEPDQAVELDKDAYYEDGTDAQLNAAIVEIQKQIAE